MGMNQKVTFAAGQAPSWPRLRQLLAGHGLAAQLRMIDGQLAFPDEEPPESWQELRIGTTNGMVTLRREPDGVQLVTWGNADAAMRQAWNANYLGRSGAKRRDSIEAQSTKCSAAEFAQTVELPATMKPGGA